MTIRLAPALLIVLLAGWLPAQTSCTTPSSGTSTIRTCNVTVVVNGVSGNWIVNKLGTLTLSSNTTLVLSPPGTADYDANIQVEPVGAGRTATISANAPWNFTVSPNTMGTPSLWTGTNDPTYGAFVPAAVDKPSTELLIGTTFHAGGTGYLALPGTNSGSTALLSNQPAVANRVIDLHWATRWWYEFDTPGQYTLPFKFVLTVP
jgi:hypothetical protein